MNSDNLTICSVSYRTRSCLELNWEVTARLNRPGSFHWVVVENSAPDCPERLRASDSRFRVVQGLACTVAGLNATSYHHAAGLNLAMQFVTSRFVLFLDPDCFIIAPEWISAVIAHMRQRKLSFFGAPNSPANHRLYRYFPCAICLFVDLEQVPRDELDFTPELDGIKAALDINRGALALWALTGCRPTSAGISKEVTWEMARCALRMRLWEKLLGRSRRFRIGYFRDTGYRIYRKFAFSRAHRSECVVPVRPPRGQAPSTSVARSIRRWLIERLLPDSVCRVPKRAGYTATSGFPSYGLPDLRSQHWEEYLWRFRPFAFHVEGLAHMSRERTHEQLDRLRQLFKLLPVQSAAVDPCCATERVERHEACS